MRRMNRKDDKYEIEGIRGSRTEGKYKRQNKGLNAKVNVWVLLKGRGPEIEAMKNPKEQTQTQSDELQLK